MQSVLVQYRRTIWSERKIDLAVACGATLKEIVDRFPDKPLEFETHGGVFMTRADGADGCYIHRKHWNRIKPKAGTKLYVSLVPHGGGSGGDSGKQIFMIVAAVALMVLTAGTASVLTPVIGTFWAGIAAGGVALGGGLALQALNKPSVGKEAPPASTGSASSGPTLGTAGIGQNPIVAWAQIPCIKGTFMGSPPVLARPYTLIDKTDQVAHVIVGYAGQYDISDIRINNTSIDDFPAGVVEYETREGWLDDEELSLITDSVFEENVGQELSKHRLHSDQETLIEPAAESYPRPYLMKTAHRTDRFRVILGFPSGIGKYTQDEDADLKFRIRFRRYDDGVAGAWVKTPELKMRGNVTTAFRQQFWVYWGSAGEELDFTVAIIDEIVASNYNPLFIDKEWSNPEWTADTYFQDVFDPDSSNHVTITNDGVYIFLDEASFPKGQYEFEITRSFIRGSEDAFLPGQFTSTGGTSVTAETINPQQDFLNAVTVLSFASFRFQYPIRRKGLAMIAVKVRNVQIQGISALFRSYVTPAIGMQVPAAGSSPVEELSYNFLDGSLHGWEAQAFGGGTPTVTAGTSGMIYKDNSAVDSNFHRTVTYAANDVDRIYLDVETVAAGAGLNGVLFANVSGGGHMFKSFSFPPVGTRQLLEFDMTTATNGGGASAGWAGKTLTTIRFDNENGGGGHFIIRSARAVHLADGSESVLSSNPAHHFYDIMTGELNGRPVPAARIEDLSEWSGHCFNEGLTLNRVVESGTTEDALVNAAGCGDAVLRRSDQYGVVVDKDRTDELSMGLVSPHIMISPLVVTVRYLNATRGSLPSFHDATNDYAIAEFESPVFDDGIPQDEFSLVESTAFDGLTDRRLVRRRALRDLRATRIRNKVYSFSLEAKVIDFKKGDKIGLAHDIILASWASGRVQSFQTSGANLVSITLNTEAVDLPADPSVDNLFLVGDVFLLTNFFSVTSGYGIGAHVELDDGSVVTVPIASVSGTLLTVEGAFATPSDFSAGALVNLGPTLRESRDVIVSNILPETGLRAKIECVDLGAEIYHNLAA